ncbi:PalH/RIM21-domain-containing protein [Pyronema domesticum]|nr:PalH/RIM21-domain-containing protein [Pyronema domesticum]
MSFSSLTTVLAPSRIMPIQNWRATTSPPQRFTLPASCTPYLLPSGLKIPLATTTTILTTAVHVTPECFTAIPTGSHDTKVSVSGTDLRDPFYASTIPMAYSIAATTTLAYVLLALLFLPNPPHSRPWLQKVATLSVCICLTIAFSETTDVLRREYLSVGSSVYSYTNEAREVRERVVGGMHIKVGRLISDLFLWLAQVQTLIRLFPRQREKVVIKWAGFALIVLDTLFGVLEAFVSPMASTDSFLDAIPALSYLFQICLSTMYAGCVIYYSFAKRRFSYFYPHRPFVTTRRYGGRSIFLVAILSIASVITPIVFFVVDIAQKDLKGWGDYIRWVGAAASSVVVWEWVDRIEGLEREDRKGGVLGREVYDEDEDLRFTGRRDEDDGLPPPPRRRGSRASESTRYEVNMRQLSTAVSSTEQGGRDGTVSPPPTTAETEATGGSRWPWKRRGRSSRRGESSSGGATGDLEEAAMHPLPPSTESAGASASAGPSATASTATSPGLGVTTPVKQEPPQPVQQQLPVHIIPAPRRLRRGV